MQEIAKVNQAAIERGTKASLARIRLLSPQRERKERHANTQTHTHQKKEEVCFRRCSANTMATDVGPDGEIWFTLRPSGEAEPGW